MHDHSPNPERTAHTFRDSVQVNVKRQANFGIFAWEMTINYQNCWLLVYNLFSLSPVSSTKRAIDLNSKFPFGVSPVATARNSLLRGFFLLFCHIWKHSFLQPYLTLLHTILISQMCHLNNMFTDVRFLHFIGKYESHTRVHTGEKPFQCDICLQRYSTKSNLTVHKKKHTSDAPFQKKEHKCPFCSKLHASKKTLAKHVRRWDIAASQHPVFLVKNNLPSYLFYIDF